MSRRTDMSRHTVPNSKCLTFPCYHEEIQLKTNVIDCDPSSSVDDANQKNIEVNVSMHDKLKMCFAEMESMKHHFDNRRRKILTKKRASKSPLAKGGETETPDPTVEADPGTDNKKADINEETKFVAHLIRTSSKDSLENLENEELPKSVEIVSESPAYEDQFHGIFSSESSPNKIFTKLNQNRRTASDPCNNPFQQRSKLTVNNQTIYGNGATQYEPFNTLQLNWSSNSGETRQQNENSSKNSSTRKSYDEWLQKLDEINDMSRSTIDRIKKLESDITNLKMFTADLTDKHKPAKPMASKIPRATLQEGPSTWTKSKFFANKSVNTDIDLQLMNKLLLQWRANYEAPVSKHLKPETSSPSRRLTTVIGRSVEIQTDSNTVNVVDKSIDTEDLIDIKNLQEPEFGDPKSKVKLEANIPIMDMPNFETKIFSIKSNSGELIANKATEIKTPEPIIEMCSDSDDTSFEDFEKNIFNQISKRAMMANRMQFCKKQKTQPNNEGGDQNEIPIIVKQQNSSTQTNDESLIVEEGKDDEPAKEMFKKNLHSTSKIVIERTRLNQKEKSEIVMKTNIDKEGKVHRTTEVTNSKFKPNEVSNTLGPYQCATAATSVKPQVYDSEKLENLRKANSDLSFYHAKNMFPRPLSAFDLTECDLSKKPNDDLLSGKAFSSLDISAKSPVISEGYHSEQYGSRQMSNLNEYLIDPPEPFQGDGGKNWKEFSNSKVSNKMVNELTDSFAENDLNKNNLITLTNETLIDCIGKKTNITTKSTTTRKFKPKDQSKAKSNMDLVNLEPFEDIDIDVDDVDYKQYDNRLCRTLSQCSLDQTMKPVQTNNKLLPFAKSNQSHNFIMSTERNNHSNLCNLSFVYNNGHDVIIRADFGITKLPCYETNL